MDDDTADAGNLHESFLAWLVEWTMACQGAKFAGLLIVARYGQA